MQRRGNVYGMITPGIILACSAWAERVLTERDINGVGETDLIFETPFFRLVVQPRRGDAGTSLIAKPSKAELANGSDGMFRDQLTSAGNRKDFLEQIYLYRVLRNDEQEAKALLSCKGTIPNKTWPMTLQKTISVSQARPAIQICGADIGGIGWSCCLRLHSVSCRNPALP